MNGNCGLLGACIIAGFVLTQLTWACMQRTGHIPPESNPRQRFNFSHHELVAPDTEAKQVLHSSFPQTQRCEGSNWQMARAEYARLHQALIDSSSTVQRYIVSVAPDSGLADRITGIVTLFYLALLSQRALTLVTYGEFPPLELACDMPLFNWTHPQLLPEDVINPLKPDFAGPRTLPDSGPINTSTYHLMYAVNHATPDVPESLAHLKHSNLSNFPSHSPDVPFVVAASNRGQTYALMHNSYHRQQLWSYGLTPETAFMCGWFSICAPNAAVRGLYSKLWDTMHEPGVLKIGIQVRLGDHVFKQKSQASGDAQLAQTHQYFDCAEKLESAFAVPNQKVVWYLMADALSLRQAAARKYGAKLLTDTTTATKHVDCRHNPGSCNRGAAELSIQRALGEMLTFSLADFHIVTKRSGFGRMGAWMSGRYNNIWEIGGHLDGACNPEKPTSYRESSDMWSKV